MGNSKPGSESNKILRRKDSFVVFDSCNDSKQETALSYPPILNDPLWPKNSIDFSLFLTSSKNLGYIY